MLAGRGATGCGVEGIPSPTPGDELGAGVGVRVGCDAPPEPIASLPPVGAVEMGGTSAVVDESTSGIAWATPSAPAAITPMLSAEIAETVTQVGAGFMVFAFDGKAMSVRPKARS
ncbi:MAG: hypothetical protein RL499_849 [Actinomycetota bacterium]